uniref:Uncharacterized protein n=1 Tax=Tanacetum cinerariifolium TaxID=118510 RepID=A0A699JMX5_TANCI|nr:hypothetical protein [Tanacetum cinerariifolium]
MNEAVKVAIQIQPDRLRDKAQEENEEFLKNLDENIQKIIKEQVKEQVKATSLSIDPKQRNLYKALVEAYESDKIILETYGYTVTLKRRRDDDADKDEEPSTGSDRGSTGKSTQGSKSRKTSASKSATAEEPMQTTHEMEEPSHPKFVIGADDQPIAEPSQYPEWFSQQKKPPTPDRDWNKTLSATHGSIQPWISELAKQTDSRSSFNELMDTPVDFSAFLMNRLKVDTLTLELLAGPTYELMKGESARDVYSKCRIITVTELEIVKWYNYKHLDWITVHRDDDKLYKFKEGYFKRLCIQDIEDMLLLLAYGRPSTRCRKLPEEAQPYKAGYNRLMRIDELHKFSDGMLTDVLTALDDRLKGIRMKYVPQTIWRKSDKERAAAMIQAIDK